MKYLTSTLLKSNTTGLKTELLSIILDFKFLFIRKKNNTGHFRSSKSEHQDLHLVLEFFQLFQQWSHWTHNSFTSVQAFWDLSYMLYEARPCFTLVGKIRISLLNSIHKEIIQLLDTYFSLIDYIYEILHRSVEVSLQLVTKCLTAAPSFPTSRVRDQHKALSSQKRD